MTKQEAREKVKLLFEAQYGNTVTDPELLASLALTLWETFWSGYRSGKAGDVDDLRHLVADLDRRTIGLIKLGGS